MLQRYFQILRSFHNSSRVMVRKPAMPGIRHQLGAFNENESEPMDDPETLEELEADFMHVGKTHRQHIEELKAQRDRVRQIIVKNKYFKEPQLPNLLLYAEKEEIRNLHAKDPEEWTVERLTESFPATPDIIRKILKGKWRPYSAKRIRAHDETVIRNWERVKLSNSNDDFLPKELREHISKFAPRTWNHLTTEKYAEDLLPKLPKPNTNEFASIITSCKRYSEETSSDKKNPFHNDNDDKNGNADEMRRRAKITTAPDPENETYLLDKIQDKRRMRLEDWKKQYQQDLVQIGGKIAAVDDDETRIMVSPENPSGTGFIEKFQQATTTNEVVISAEDSKRYEISTYKEQIHIPRKLWRQGATYRIDDCYYDDDGEFLYRVPGIKKLKS